MAKKNKKDKKNKTIFLVAGGTGGHIFPAQALYEELSSRGYKPILVTDERYEKYVSNDHKFEHIILPVKQVKGNILEKLAALIMIIVCYIKSIFLLRKYKPICAVGFGGYPSFPTMLAASESKKVKAILHEQNSLLGRANEMLIDKANAIATSFPEVSGIDENNYRKVVFTGNPVRPAVQKTRDLPYPDFHENSNLNILVTGGSQGASVFSKVVPDAIAKLPKIYRERIKIDQQCRAEDLEEVKAKYKKMNIEANLDSFFSDLPERLANSHVVISRSGASTLTEIAVAGRPAIMVPLPNSKDNHQMVNANSFEDQGIGWVMPEESFTAENLSTRLQTFFTLDNLLIETAQNAKKSGAEDADKKLADLIEKLSN